MRATQTGIFRRAPPASPLHSKLPLGFQFCENHRTPPARRIEWGNVEVRRTTPLPSPSLALPWSCFFCAIAAGQPIYCIAIPTPLQPFPLPLPTVTRGPGWTRLVPHTRPTSHMAPRGPTARSDTHTVPAVAHAVPRDHTHMPLVIFSRRGREGAGWERTARVAHSRVTHTRPAVSRATPLLRITTRRSSGIDHTSHKSYI